MRGASWRFDCWLRRGAPPSRSRNSGLRRDAVAFANGKPLELIDGGNLLYLLQEHVGIEAKIVAPEDWVEPEPDA